MALAANIDAGRDGVYNYYENLDLLSKTYEGWEKLSDRRVRWDEVAQNWVNQQNAAENLRDAYIDLARGMGAVSHDAMGEDIEPSLSRLTALADTAAPALEALGYSVEELRSMAAAGDTTGLIQVGQEVAAWIQSSISAAGRTDALASAMKGLSDPTLSAAAAATELQAALDNLLNPTLSAEEATDAWRVSLAALEKDLKSTAGLPGVHQGRPRNRQMTRDYVEDAKTRLVSLAGLSTTTEGEMARAVAKTRQEFIKVRHRGRVLPQGDRRQGA